MADFERNFENDRDDDHVHSEYGYRREDDQGFVRPEYAYGHDLDGASEKVNHSIDESNSVWQERNDGPTEHASDFGSVTDHDTSKLSVLNFADDEEKPALAGQPSLRDTLEPLPTPAPLSQVNRAHPPESAQALSEAAPSPSHDHDQDITLKADPAPLSGDVGDQTAGADPAPLPEVDGDRTDPATLLDLDPEQTSRAQLTAYSEMVQSEPAPLEPTSESEVTQSVPAENPPSQPSANSVVTVSDRGESIYGGHDHETIVETEEDTVIY